MSSNTGKLRVRPAEHCDYPIVQRLSLEAGLHPSLPSEGSWQRELMATTRIAETEQGAVGYVSYQELGSVAELRQLVIAKDARRRGHGTALLRQVSERLVASGALSWSAKVKPDNGPALALCERVGLRATHRSSALVCDSGCRARLPTSGAARAYGVLPSDDAALEYQFGLPTGVLGQARASGKTLAQLRSVEGGKRLGVAAFDLAMKTVMPFRVARPDLAHTLLHGACRSLDSVDGSVTVAIEHDDTLLKTFLVAGAHVEFELAHFSALLSDTVSMSA